MSNRNNDLYEFENFRLDARTKVLYCAGSPVSLKPKTVETLIALVENAGEVVSKDELMNRVWQNTFVAENSLSVNIYALRKMFAEFGDGQDYIQTVPRRGFRFAAEVRKVFDEKKSAAETHPVSDFVAPETEKQEIPQELRTTNGKTPFLIYRQQILAVVILMVASVFAVGASFYALSERRETEAAKNSEPPQNAEAGRGTKSKEAADFYLRGYRLWQTRDYDQMARGVDLFKRAVELDPNFVAAQLGLADSYSMMNNSPAEWRLAEEYSDAALRLAPDSADAHATRGFILAFNKWQWREAEESFKHALALDENSGKAHQWYAALLIVNRRFAEAETHLKRAIEIYPDSPNYNFDLIELYFADTTRPDNFALVREKCGRMERLNPETALSAACSELEILMAQRRFDEAARLKYQALLSGGRTIEQVENSDWYKAYKSGGWRGWIRQEIEQTEGSSDGYNATFKIASKYALIGDRENALRWLDKALTERVFLLPFANTLHDYDALRGDPGFQNIMRRVGLNQN